MNKVYPYVEKTPEPITIYRVYESNYGEVCRVKVYLNEQTALNDFKARNTCYAHMDEEELIEE